MSEKRYPYCKFTIMEEKQIIEEYQAGASMASLGKKWNCDPSTIKNILKAYQVSARTLSQARKNFLKETLNESLLLEWQEAKECDMQNMSHPKLLTEEELKHNIYLKNKK